MPEKPTSINVVPPTSERDIAFVFSNDGDKIQSIASPL